MAEPPQPSGSKHIRPRVRHRSGQPKPLYSSAGSVASAGDTTANDPFDAAAVVVKGELAASTTSNPPTTTKGILKHNPKYTQRLVEAAASTAAAEASVYNDNDDEKDLAPRPTAAVKDTIVERKVSRRKTKAAASAQTAFPNPTLTAAQASGAIEGYVPSTGNNKNSANASAMSQPQTKATDNNNNEEEEEEEDLVFNSLADLMEQAGTLPPKDQQQDMGQEGTVVEADLQFSVMSPEEFAAQLEDQDEGHIDYVSSSHDSTTGVHDIAAEEEEGGNMNPATDKSDHNDDDSNDSEKENSEGAGFSMMDLMGDDDDDMEPVETRDERAFLVLWKALSQWVTPDAAAFVLSRQKHVHENGQQQPQQPNTKNTPPTTTQWSDVESTRCAGLMSLLQLYLGPCLEDDLQRPLEERRVVEQLLGQLIRHFDFAQPSPKLGSSQARALTCILLVSVEPEYLEAADTPLVPPPSCQAVGLTAEEYGYLVQRGIAGFVSLQA